MTFSESSFSSSGTNTTIRSNQMSTPPPTATANHNHCFKSKRGPDRNKHTLDIPRCFEVFPSRWNRLRLWCRSSMSSTFMATSHQDAAAAVHVPNQIRKEKLIRLTRRKDLEREVSMLGKLLDHEQKTHEYLEGVVHGRTDVSDLGKPNFLPPKVKELLEELVVVEDEITRLEGQISQLQTDIDCEKEAAASNESKSELQSNGSNEKLAFETKALHFISKAIKGDYGLNHFSMNSKLRRSSGGQISNQKENHTVHQLQEVAFQERVPKKSGLLLKPPSPLREPRNPTPKREHILDNLIKFPPQYSLSTPIHYSEQEEEEGIIQKWTPNKLSENIMKCLILIFARLLRTSRAMELEKSGPISRSANNFSLSFRVDQSSFNSPMMIHKESKQQDPYGIFDAEDSIPRDIGPYKNLVIFTSNSLDTKYISNSCSVPLLQRLRVLMNGLQKVDMRALNDQQKLAFWINMYNACVMHGFLQYGVPSTPEKFLALLKKATISIGGNTINAQAIEHSILRKPTTSTIKEVYRNVEIEDKEAAILRTVHGLESSDPNVTFALCCGTRSSPAVRIYTGDGAAAELEKSKLEFLQASIVVTSTKRIALPEILLRNMHDFAKDAESLIQWVCHQLPTSGSLRKSIVDCFRGPKSGRPSSSALVQSIPYQFEFQYLLSI